MSGGIEVIHRRGTENAEEFRRETKLYFLLSGLCESPRSLRLCSKSIRPRAGRRAP